MYVICFAGIVVQSCNHPQPVTDNPFLIPFDTPFEVPPFDKIQNRHYLPAFREGIKEQEAEIQLEMDIIKATIEARKKSMLTQRELSAKSGIKQPIIARIEKNVNSPRVSTLMKLLYSMGYTLKVVPLKDSKKDK